MHVHFRCLSIIATNLTFIVRSSIIIIIVFTLIRLFLKLNGLNGHFRNNAYNSVRWACLVSLAPKREKNTLQYGNGKWGTHARVFSLTLAHGNSKNEIRKKDKRRR